MDEWWLGLYDKKWCSDDEGMATERSPLGKLNWWISTQSKSFSKKIRKISSVRAKVYLVLTFQAQAKLSIVGKWVSSVEAQQSLRGC